MLRLRHLNMDKAVSKFLQNVEALTRLPLITDDDLSNLWGAEVVESINELSRYNSQENICGTCPKSCCPTVHCEFYYPGFSQCPIFPLRPAICRMHFCDRFSAGDISFVREFADIYLNSLLEAKLQGSQKVDLFDSPPLLKYAPELVAAVTPLIDSFKTGHLKEPEAQALIQVQAENFRTSAAVQHLLKKEDKHQQALYDEARRELNHL